MFIRCTIASLNGLTVTHPIPASLTQHDADFTPAFGVGALVPDAGGSGYRCRSAVQR